MKKSHKFWMVVSILIISLLSVYIPVFMFGVYCVWSLILLVGILVTLFDTGSLTYDDDKYFIDIIKEDYKQDPILVGMCFLSLPIQVMTIVSLINKTLDK